MNIEYQMCALTSHTPALLQMGDGSMTNVAPVHSSWESDGSHTLIDRLQCCLQCRPDCCDSEDASTARHHASILEGSACMKNLQLHVLKLRQT